MLVVGLRMHTTQTGCGAVASHISDRGLYRTSGLRATSADSHRWQPTARCSSRLGVGCFSQPSSFSPSCWVLIPRIRSYCSRASPNFPSRWCRFPRRPSVAYDSRTERM
jgi:hypothetical protein